MKPYPDLNSQNDKKLGRRNDQVAGNAAARPKWRNRDLRVAGYVATRHDQKLVTCSSPRILRPAIMLSMACNHELSILWLQYFDVIVPRALV